MGANRTLFYKSLLDSGLVVNAPPQKCVAHHEPIFIIRNLKKTLQKQYDNKSIDEFIMGFKHESQTLESFKHFLYPNIVQANDDSTEEQPLNYSLIKILLNVPSIQKKLMDFIFDKATDLASENKCKPVIQVILKCFEGLDCIISSEAISQHLMNLLEVSGEKFVQWEIITAIPDIIGDQDHNNIAIELSRFLTADHELIPVILDCLTYLCLSDEQYLQLQKTSLHLLTTLSKCTYFPNFINFLLMPGRMNESGYLETIKAIRNALGWSKSSTKTQEIANSQVLTAAAIRRSIVSSKNVETAWMKVLMSCKDSSDYKPLDFIVSLIIYTVSEDKQKLIENLLRKCIKNNILKEDIIRESCDNYKPLLIEYLSSLIELSNSLLKCVRDPVVESFAINVYTLMFSILEEHRQRIIADLLLLGFDQKQCVLNILNILSKIATLNMSSLEPHSLQMLTLLDRMDGTTLNEIREIMNLICGLAFNFENSKIKDDVEMIIRKELSSSSPTVKVQGILAGVYAVKYLMTRDSEENVNEERPENVSYGLHAHLRKGPSKDAAQIVEMIICSTAQLPELAAFFYEECYTVISNTSGINPTFLIWLTDAVTNDFQQKFVSDSDLGSLATVLLKSTLQYNLNPEESEVIAINIAGLVLEPINETHVGLLSPLFQLVQALNFKQNDGDLSDIDALLGCPVIMPEFDFQQIEELDFDSINNILNCLFYCVNWFRELINAFASQKCSEVKEKVFHRIFQIENIEDMIMQILLKVNLNNYKSPIHNFNINKYVGKQIDKHHETQFKKANSKKINDTIVTENVKSQNTPATTHGPNSRMLKLRTDGPNLLYRPVGLNLLELFKNNLSLNSNSRSELNIKALNFLFVNFNMEFEYVLISKIKKRTFLTKNDSYRQLVGSPIECAKRIMDMLPNIMSHMIFIIQHIEDSNIITDDVHEIPIELIFYFSCLEHLYRMLCTYFNWIGFKSDENKLLLKNSLKALVSVSNKDVTRMTLKDMLLDAANRFQGYAKYCIQMSSAVSLLYFLNILVDISGNAKSLLMILKNVAYKFLNSSWKTYDGAVEKGIHFNKNVDQISGIYFTNNELSDLKNLTLKLITEIQTLK